ncbi:hypothetical protein VTI74DRAFT_7545 [Chaetomium olivicolor]
MEEDKDTTASSRSKLTLPRLPTQQPGAHQNNILKPSSELTLSKTAIPPLQDNKPSTSQSGSSGFQLTLPKLPPPQSGEKTDDKPYLSHSQPRPKVPAPQPRDSNPKPSLPPQSEDNLKLKPSHLGSSKVQLTLPKIPPPQPKDIKPKHSSSASLNFQLTLPKIPQAKPKDDSPEPSAPKLGNLQLTLPMIPAPQPENNPKRSAIGSSSFQLTLPRISTTPPEEIRPIHSLTLPGLQAHGSNANTVRLGLSTLELTLLPEPELESNINLDDWLAPSTTTTRLEDNTPEPSRKRRQRSPSAESETLEDICRPPLSKHARASGLPPMVSGLNPGGDDVQPYFNLVDGQYRCNVCGFQLRARSSSSPEALAHLRSHGHRWKCPYCAEYFVTQHGLRVRMISLGLSCFVRNRH